MEKVKTPPHSKLSQHSNRSPPLSPTGTSSASIRDNFSWTFSKADRFNGAKTRRSAEYLNLPSTLKTNIGTSLGFGRRSELFLSHNADLPAPSTYQTDLRFLRTYVPGPKYRKQQTEDSTRSPKESLSPGPGHYLHESPIGSDAPMFTFKYRPKDLTMPKSPGPESYSPLESLTSMRRYSNIAFGSSQRSNLGFSKLYIDTDNYPGPGTYTLPSRFSLPKLPNQRAETSKHGVETTLRGKLA